MKISLKNFRIALALLTVALCLTGCASTPRFDGVADDFGRYRHIAVEAIEFAPAAIADARDVDFPALAQKFHRAVVEELSASIEGSDDDALRLKLTIKELNSSNPLFNVASMLMVYLPFDTGGVVFEATFSDASGRTVVSMEQRLMSTPLNIKGSLSRYGHATEELRKWSRNLQFVLAKNGATTDLAAANSIR